jgi:hypothetical protein
MVDLSAGLTLISELAALVKKIGGLVSGGLGLSERKRQHRVLIYNAVISIRRACIESSQCINTRGYVANNELVDRWHLALKACVEAGLEGEIPNYLYSKAEFWAEPQLWIENPIALELVPQLDYLKRACDDLLARML